MLFIDDDMGADTHLDDGLLKAISEAKEMSARYAYGERHFKFRCLALPVIGEQLPYDVRQFARAAAAHYGDPVRSPVRP